MRKNIAQFLSSILLCLALLTSVGCFDKTTSYGKCIGVFDDRKPNLEYKLSVWNGINGILWSELLFIPTLYWLADFTFCPVDKKDDTLIPTGLQGSIKLN